MAVKRAPSARIARNVPDAKASTGEDALRVPDKVVAEVTARLRRVEGQVRAVQRMIAERRDCHAVVQQMAAARAALEKATVQLMATSMAECIRPKAGGGIDEAELKRLTDTFVKLLG
ncbi:MAG: metal-sensitive transcriptional regulator [Candidatus Velthaea sp.]|jgi:DNA-binding FrmR family transcriptional regulator